MASESLRIAIDGRPALWLRTGIGTIAFNVLKNIQNVDRVNQYFAYFNTDSDVEISRRLSIESRMGGPRHKLAWANTWLPRQLSRDGIDVFITFLDKELPLVPTRARVVSMVHDLIPLKFPSTVFRNAAHRLYYTELIRASARRSDIILTNSEYSRQEIVSGLGLPESKVRRITLGVDSIPQADDQTHVSQVLHRYSLRRPFVIALGATEPRKNNLRVIEAARRLFADHPDLQLAIAGDNWRGHVFDSGLLDDRVRLLGYVSQEDLPILMQSAEVLAFPSLHEGFGFPVIEAMALGVPVVTSNVTALPEVAGGAALLVNPNHVDEIAAALGRILENPDLAADLSRRGLARAAHFRWETTCSEIVAICEALVNRHEWRREPVAL
jgi:glycosyltransferase involved in cell wall biosynthesis